AVSAAGAGPAPEWLRRLNYYRTLARLAPVVEDAALSRGDNKHAVYLVKNYAETIKKAGLGADAHSEERGNPWYSPEGLAAAHNSDVDEWYIPGGELTPPPDDPDEWVADRAPGSEAWTIDGWVELPLHRLPILNPNLRSAGYGKYCESGECVAALDLGHFNTSKADSAPLGAPIEFPPADAVLPLRSFSEEWPDPRTSCPGYAAPSGLPMTLQLGDWIDAQLGVYSIARVVADGKSSQLEACGFDSASYANPDREAQGRVRDILKSTGAVVVIPREPLEKGAKYRVAITVNGKQYNWSFSTAP
ncbi:MAG TPA: CAP domain-containing protein, partial [Candidatus Binataceae bacterium]